MERRPALPALTGVRTLLAVGIMLFHYTPPHLGLIRPLIDAGFLYIGFFLLISGFVLSYNYAHRAATLRPGIFYAARLARLYPVYLFSLLVSLEMLHSEFVARSAHSFWTGTVLTVLLVQGWSPEYATFWNTVAWTLSAEAMLYLAFPWINRLPWPNTRSGLLKMFALCWASEMLLPLIYYWTNPDGLPPLDRYSSGYWIRALKYTPLPYLPVFLSGVTLGRLEAVSAVSDRRRLTISVAAIAAAVLLIYLVVPHIPYIITHGGLLTPVFALVVFGLTGNHWLSRVLGWGPLGTMGRASFCLYLLHFNGWNLIHDHHLPERVHLAALEPWFSYVVLIGVSLVVWRWFERPVQGWILNHWVYRTPRD